VPTVFSHPAVALAKTWFPRVPPRAYAVGALLTVLPDLDVVSFALGIPYASTFGHRGFTHSLLFALLASVIVAVLLRARPTLPTFAFLCLCAVSHPVLDAMTTGGLGVAFFSPISNARYFLPWRPIRVSPIGARFFSARGWAVVMSEVRWVWVPWVVVGLAGHLKHRGDVEREVREQR
jgi:inner membrane protein